MNNVSAFELTEEVINERIAYRKEQDKTKKEIL